MCTTKHLIVGATFAVLTSIASQVAHGGPLAIHPNAYFDGVTTWRGSTFYPTFASLNVGTVDWAVFDANGFAQSGITGLGGWTPVQGEMVYAYQVFQTGSVPANSYQVIIPNVASNTGTADTGLAGSAPTSFSLISLALAVWDISLGTSVGLVYSSKNVPEHGTAFVFCSTPAFVDPVPSPSATPIPEPGAAMLAACGLLLLSVTRIRAPRWYRGR